jgi:hypothetical protein
MTAAPRREYLNACNGFLQCNMWIPVTVEFRFFGTDLHVKVVLGKGIHIWI